MCGGGGAAACVGVCGRYMAVLLYAYVSPYSLVTGACQQVI